MTAKLLGLILSRLISPAASFLVLILIARHWGSGPLGEYTLVYAWLVVFQYVAMPGVTEYISRELGYGKKRTAECLTNGLLLVTLSSGLCTIVMAGCAAFIPLPGSVRYCMLIASLALPFTAYTSFCQAAFTALHKIRLIALAGVAENTIFLAAVAAVILNKFGLPHLLWALVLARAVGAIVNLFLLTAHIGNLECRPDWHVLRGMVTTASVFGVTSLAFQIYTRADVIIMGWLQDMEMVGLYSASSRLLEVCTMLPLAFYLLHLPVAANAYRNRRKFANREMQQLASRFFFGIFFVFGAGVLLADSLLKHLYGAEFQPAATVLRVLLCVFVLHSVQLVLEMCCQGAGYQKFAMYVALLRAGASIGLNLALIPAFGALGGALAALSSTSISLTAFWCTARKKLGGMSLGRAIAPSAAVCVATTLLLYAAASYVGASATALMFTAVYMALTLAVSGASDRALEAA